MAAPIRFHFDYISPYAYIAWTQLPRLAKKHGRAVEPIPTLFAALLDAGGQKGPAEIPAKRAWIWKDTLWTARALGIPLVPPPHHPFNPLLALRVTGLVEGAPARARLIDALFARTWGGGAGIESADAVSQAANEAGLDGKLLVQRATEPSTKTLLRHNTEQAIAAGVFGVPTLLIDDELFWGYDAFPHIERYLRGEARSTAEDRAQWDQVTPSAQRRSNDRAG